MGIVPGKQWCVDEEAIKKLHIQKTLNHEQHLELLGAHARANELTREVKELINRAQALQIRVDRYEAMFASPDIIADRILKTDLNLGWMDDGAEKKYIMQLMCFMCDNVNDQPEADHV